MTREPALAVDTLSKAFGGLRAVAGVSFDLAAGERIALIGPNGSGKTTLVNLLTGFLHPDAGTATYRGVSLVGLPPHRVARLGIGRTFQMLRLFPQISVLENMLLARRTPSERLVPSLLRGPSVRRSEKRLREIAETHLERVGLWEKRDALASTLSHGQRKLLELARVLAGDAQLLLLDEPVAGVFPATRRKIVQLMKEEAEQGRAILFIEHDLRLVREAAQSAIVLDHGKKIAEGPPEIVLRHPRVVAAYLGLEDAHD